MKALLAGALLVAASLPGGAWAETHTVRIVGMKFQPQSLTVRPGDQVEWRNEDLVPHTATAGQGFDSGAIPPGGRWSWKAQAPGHLAYLCTYHPDMKATVTVR